MKSSFIVMKKTHKTMKQPIARRFGFVCVRNPYNQNQVSRYRLSPDVVDVIGFCTKNPAPMFKYMDLLKDYGQYWYVTITPYGRDIEPNVPDKHKLIEDFKTLSDIVGVNSIGWRFDPIFISDRYTQEYHIHAFEQIATALNGYTKTVVISFIDLYPKVKRNFPEAKDNLENNYIRIKELRVVDVEGTKLFKKGFNFLLAKFFGKKYGKSF